MFQNVVAASYPLHAEAQPLKPSDRLLDPQIAEAPPIGQRGLDRRL
jgi:hypothetical protein